jgi:hypothetical protein
MDVDAIGVADGDDAVDTAVTGATGAVIIVGAVGVIEVVVVKGIGVVKAGVDWGDKILACVFIPEGDGGVVGCEFKLSG